MNKIVLASILALTATNANALSCLRPDAVRLFEMVRDAEASYYVVKGRVSLLEAANAPDPETEKPAMTRARVTGRALGAGGFATPFEQDITIAATCLSIWCGSAENLKDDLIMGLELTDTGPVLNIGPCGGDQVTWDQSGEDRLLACHQGGICTAEDF